MNTTLDRLLLDLADSGIFLEADGERLHYRPQSAMTPELLERLRANKADVVPLVLAAKAKSLDSNQQRVEIDLGHGLEIWTECTEIVEGQEHRVLRRADAAHFDRWDSAIEPHDPCTQCGSLELWETLTGQWRCLRCDPPTKARQLRELAARSRKKHLPKTQFDRRSNQR